jgi:hypothetical protein
MLTVIPGKIIIEMQIELGAAIFREGYIVPLAHGHAA